MSCGGHLVTEHPGMGMTDVYAAILPALAFNPVFHVHYAESVLPLHDGIAKFRDTPKEVGGSGETMPERVTVAPGVAFGRALSYRPVHGSLAVDGFRQPFEPGLEVHCPAPTILS